MLGGGGRIEGMLRLLFELVGIGEVCDIAGGELRWCPSIWVGERGDLVLAYAVELRGLVARLESWGLGGGAGGGKRSEASAATGGVGWPCVRM